MAPRPLLSTLFVLSCIRAVTIATSEDKVQPATRTLTQLRSILAFLPRAQKCDKLLFDLMKECVDEGNTLPLPTTTKTPERLEETTVNRRVLPPAAPADDEDSSFQGSGDGSSRSRLLSGPYLPEEASRYRAVSYSDTLQTKPSRPGLKDGKKTNKNKKKKKMMKMKRIGLKRTSKKSRGSSRKSETRDFRNPRKPSLGPVTTEKKSVEPAPLPATKVDTAKPSQDSWDPTSMRAHSPEFFKYMGMG